MTCKLVQKEQEKPSVQICTDCESSALKMTQNWMNSLVLELSSPRPSCLRQPLNPDVSGATEEEY